MNNIEDNKILCNKYPFLKPKNVWTGKDIDNYDYSYTLLDQMPDGWRKAFGEQLCEELYNELKRYHKENTYLITQIKEKYGSLRWYDMGNTKRGYEIINKYEELSERICICCGKPATRITTNWISPYCNDCIPTYDNGEEEYTIPIESYYKD